MNKLKRTLVILVIVLGVVLVGTFAAAMVSKVVYEKNHVFVGEHAFDKKSDTLDLRGMDISLEEVAQLQAALPFCQITYDVPFQGTLLSSSITELTVTALAEEDIDQLRHFPTLASIQAEGCSDYSALASLRERYPNLTVSYSLVIAGQNVPYDIDRLTLTGASGEDLALIPYLSSLTDLHLSEPTATAQQVCDLRAQLPGVSVTCQKEVLGQNIDASITELDLSGITLTGTEQLEDLRYFNTLEKVILGQCGLENEDLAAYREQVRGDYTLVWTVMCGTIPVRTDETTFMPIKHHVYYFHDKDVYNLRYCEEMICIDLGHMTFHNIDFVAFMPHLKYLVLAHTTLSDITPISNCKELVFLEIDGTTVKDYSPLLGCTALEDLNLGLTFGDPAPVKQMTWLKNLWWVGRNNAFKLDMAEALPDTHKEFFAKRTVGNGWRELPNYFAMRDMLGVEYMD